MQIHEFLSLREINSVGVSAAYPIHAVAHTLEMSFSGNKYL